MGPPDDWEAWRQKIIGLGDHSSHKSYYPELQRKLVELQRFRALLDLAGDAILLVQFAGGRLVDANEAVAALAGRPRQQMLETPLCELLPEVRLDDLPPAGLEGPQGKLTVRSPLRRGDGSALLVEVHARRAVLDELEYAVLAVRDIGELLESERALRESEANLRAVFDAAYDAFFVHDEHGRMLAINARTRALLGFDDAQTTAGLVEHFVADFEGQRQALHERWARAVRGEDQFFEFKARRPTDGGQFDVEISLRAVSWSGRQAVLAVVRDVTERKRAEQEKARLEEELRQAQKIESIGRLAGGVAHDFNNLLTGILGNMELMMQELSPADPLQESLLEIQKASMSAAAVTRQLLAFSRKQLIAPRVLEPNQLIGQMTKMLVRLIGEDVELRTVLGEGIGRVRADPGQLEQVVVNLAVNARDAMPRGGLLTLETAAVALEPEFCRRHPELRPGPHVLLSVRDSGTGMSDEVKSHLFEPFFTTKARGKGTGLGLATVYGCVRQNGGAIEVDSQLGQGTRLRIYLPRVDAAPDAVAGQPTDLPGGPESVMVVEDAPLVREMAVRVLRRLGYQVHACENGGEALAALRDRETKVDLLLTDVVMPGINGRDLAEEANLEHPGLKVLFTSGYTDEVVVGHGVLGEGVRFLPKPYTVSALAKKVREVLEES